MKVEHSELAVPGYLPLMLRVGVAEQRAAMFATLVKAGLAQWSGTEAAKNSVLLPRRKYTGLKVQGNVGIIEVKGVIEKDLSWVSWLMGDATHEEIQDQLRDALARDEVTKVLMVFDTPGGTVYGIDETRQLIQAVDKKKPVFGHASGCVCSAGYALASACRKLTMTEMSEAGSIGVVLTVIDQSGFDKEMGFKVTEITAGEFKRAGSAHKPLDAKSAAYLQALVDKHMDVFKGWVQTGRDLSDAQLEAVANGKVFIGTDAVDLGLVDRIATYDDVLSSLLDEETTTTTNFLQGVLEMAENKPAITMAWLVENAPELAQELRAEGVKSVDVASEVKAAVDTALKSERERVKEIMELAPAGFQAEANSMIAEGTSAAEAAKAFLKGAKEKGAQLLDAHRQDAPVVVDHSSTDQDATAEADKQILAATAAFNASRKNTNNWSL